jgi:hypothetical protein
MNRQGDTTKLPQRNRSQEPKNFLKGMRKNTKIKPTAWLWVQIPALYLSHRDQESYPLNITFLLHS